jgi:thiol-disulfide isomerase/thioredoxin
MEEKKMEIKLALFYSEGCKPCQHQKPLIEKISKEKDIPLEVISVDSNAGFDYAQQYSVKGWPHLLVINKEDIIVDEIIGYDFSVPEKDNKKRIMDTLKKYMDIKKID